MATEKLPSKGGLFKSYTFERQKIPMWVWINSRGALGLNQMERCERVIWEERRVQENHPQNDFLPCLDSHTTHRQLLPFNSYCKFHSLDYCLDSEPNCSPVILHGHQTVHVVALSVHRKQRSCKLGVWFSHGSLVEWVWSPVCSVNQQQQ